MDELDGRAAVYVVVAGITKVTDDDGPPKMSASVARIRTAKGFHKVQLADVDDVGGLPISDFVAAVTDDISSTLDDIWNASLDALEPIWVEDKKGSMPAQPFVRTNFPKPADYSVDSNITDMSTVLIIGWVK